MSSPRTSAISHADFVTGDVNALALHMRDCARAHGRFSATRSALQHVHSIAAGHLVTVVCGAVIVGLGLLALA